VDSYSSTSDRIAFHRGVLEISAVTAAEEDRFSAIGEETGPGSWRRSRDHDASPKRLSSKSVEIVMIHL
jgi:hypothetical protein